MLNKEKYSRTAKVLGEESVLKLNKSNVIVFGVGGVGSFIVEALVRSGVENITIVDNDVVSVSNINRQLCAMDSTIGLPKVEVIKNRIYDINPDCNVNALMKFYLPESGDEFNLEKYDYICDAIDTVSAKIDIAERAEKFGIPIISCMGTGNKTDPTKFKISDIYDTSVCPLCRVMRTELRKRNVKSLNVLWSDEAPQCSNIDKNSEDKRIPGSLSFVPGTAGLIIAGKIIKDLAGII